MASINSRLLTSCWVLRPLGLQRALKSDFRGLEGFPGPRNGSQEHGLKVLVLHSPLSDLDKELAQAGCMDVASVWDQPMWVCNKF